MVLDHKNLITELEIAKEKLKEYDEIKRLNTALRPMDERW
jgi:hypothetical protein